MRGHDDLIRLRKAGKKPAGLVYVDDYPVLPKHTHWLKSGAIPSICTHGDDVGSLEPNISLWFDRDSGQFLENEYGTVLYFPNFPHRRTEF